MNKSQSLPRDRRQEYTPPHSNNEVQYLLESEERVLQSISSGAPLTDILDGICLALNCQIGNMVSFISLPDDDASDLAPIARNAGLFGLFAFCPEGIIAGNGKLLGSLEMYSCDSRSPIAGEFRCIERAKYLVSIAINRYSKAARRSNRGIRDSRPVQGRVLGRPDTIQ
jgi:hypothetical protein